MAESKKELKSILIKVKEESENTGLNHSIQKMDHGIRSHQFMPVDGETMGTVTDYFFLRLQNHLVTAVMKLKDICPLEEKL